jgi:hypothetical protein
MASAAVAYMIYPRLVLLKEGFLENKIMKKLGSMLKY